MKTKKKRRKPKEIDHAANRRKLLAKLSPKAREYAIQEFARLGLYQ